MPIGSIYFGDLEMWLKTLNFMGISIYTYTHYIEY